LKIKIPSQINRKISDEADVIDNSMKGRGGGNLPDSNNLIGIAEHGNGDPRVYQILGVEYNGVKYISALPSPTHMFLSTAVELYQISENRKQANFPKCATKMSTPKLAILQFQNGYTHECFTDYLKAKTTSIIMLISALENFMNQQIPQDYTYTWFDKKKDKTKTWNYDEIENSISFNTKLKYVIPRACDRENLWGDYSEELDIIQKLYSHRKEFVHLKTKSKEEWKRYADAFDQMVNFNLEEAIKAVIKIMNIISPEFVEEE